MKPYSMPVSVQTSPVFLKIIETSLHPSQDAYVRIPKALYQALKPDIHGAVNAEVLLEACVDLALKNQLVLS